MTRKQRWAAKVFGWIDEATWHFGPKVGRNRYILAIKRPLIRIFAP